MNPRTKNILTKLLFLLAIPLIIGAFVFASKENKKEVCQGVYIKIQNPQFSFISEKEIKDFFTAQHIIPNQTLISQIACNDLEKKLNSNNWIRNANVYIDANQVIHADIIQKNPVLRVQNRDSSGQGYYLDEYANHILLSPKYAANLPIATASSLGFLKKDMDQKKELVKLAMRIDQDSFWSAFVTQIILTDEKEINLVPAIGNQLIRLGTIESMDDKLNRLFVFYQKGLKTYPWDLYDEVDVRFERQIVVRNNNGKKLTEDPYDIDLKKEELKAMHTTADKPQDKKQHIQVPKIANKVSKPASASNTNKSNPKTH